MRCLTFRRLEEARQQHVEYIWDYLETLHMAVLGHEMMLYGMISS